jgi:Fuc2NAc and GlcNAc transferase
VRTLEIGLFLVATLVAAALTNFLRSHALRVGMMDVPNERSSHLTPTPRGGGLGFVLVTLSGTALIGALGRLDINIAAVLIAAGSLVAVVGYLDDKRGLAALPRFAVHVAASVMVVVMLMSVSSAHSIDGTAHWLIALVLVVGTAWSINSFNFMDGIDGIAASQAVFVTVVSAALVLRSESPELAGLLLLSTGASLGFLLLNWPPARIFMGDVGSGFLGFWMAAIALLLHVKGALSIFTSVILSSLFLSDATTTLLRRIAGRKRWYEAHRSHAYQQLARRWRSHGKVTGLLWLLNLLVVFPLAQTSVLIPKAAPAISVGTVIVFGVLAWLAGAGRDDGVGANRAPVE